MPEPPEGEHDLRALADEHIRAEGYVTILLAEAAAGSRTRAVKWALERLAALRLLDVKGPVIAAYLAEHPKGRRSAVDDLAGSLALRLDRGARTAADGVRDSFRRVTRETLDEYLDSPITAAVDTSGTRWSLGHWAEMTTTTIGGHATSRGLADAIGDGNTVTISVGECGLCARHAGQAVIGSDPLPPYHPSCSCVASAA
jgi:hypothetical protein